MKVHECRNQRVFDIGFIDPYNIHEHTIKNFPAETEANLLKCLKKPNTISLQLQVSVTVLYYKFYFAYSMLSVVELYMPAYINVCAGSTGSC